MSTLWQFLNTERLALSALYTCGGEGGEVLRKERERQGLSDNGILRRREARPILYRPLLDFKLDRLDDIFL